MYFKEICLHRELRTLREIGIRNGSEIDFCVSGEVTCLKVHFKDQTIIRNRPEHSLVVDVCQDVLHVVTRIHFNCQRLRKDGYRQTKDETLQLTLYGLHLDDNIQLCSYPLLHINQEADVYAEVVRFLGVGNGGNV